MFSVIFEVHPKQARFDDYLANAKQLKPILEAIDGFIDNERFKSGSHEGWLLSHSTWRDEKAVVRWRTTPEHHDIQQQGRDGIFTDYHLRVGEIVQDSAPPAGNAVREQRLDVTEIGDAKYATLTEIEPGKPDQFDAQTAGIPARLGMDAQGQGIVAHDLFSSITNPGKLALLISWATIEQARAFEPKALPGIETLRHRTVRIVRDYGMYDRREAPQYYPDVERTDRG